MEQLRTRLTTCDTFLRARSAGERDSARGKERGNVTLLGTRNAVLRCRRDVRGASEQTTTSDAAELGNVSFTLPL